MKLFELIKSIKIKTNKSKRKIKKEIDNIIKIELEKLSKKYKKEKIHYNYYITKEGKEKSIIIEFWKVKIIKKEEVL